MSAGHGALARAGAEHQARTPPGAAPRAGRRRAGTAPGRRRTTPGSAPPARGWSGPGPGAAPRKAGQVAGRGQAADGAGRGPPQRHRPGLPADAGARRRVHPGIQRPERRQQRRPDHRHPPHQRHHRHPVVRAHDRRRRRRRGCHGRRPRGQRRGSGWSSPTLATCPSPTSPVTARTGSSPPASTATWKNAPARPRTALAASARRGDRRDGRPARHREGIAAYRQRGRIAETPHGRIKHNMRCVSCRSADMRKAAGEWTFACTVHNIMMAITSGHLTTWALAGRRLTPASAARSTRPANPPRHPPPAPAARTTADSATAPSWAPIFSTKSLLENPGRDGQFVTFGDLLLARTGVSSRGTPEAPGNRMGVESSAMPGALRVVVPCRARGCPVRSRRSGRRRRRAAGAARAG